MMNVSVTSECEPEGSDNGAKDAAEFVGGAALLFHDGGDAERGADAAGYWRSVIG